TARSHAQLGIAVEVHLAVSAEAAGAHIDRSDHRAPAAEHGSLRPHDRATASDDRHIGRRTAHVRYREVGKIAEEAGADDARRGPRKYRLHRILERNLRADQGA